MRGGLEHPCAGCGFTHSKCETQRETEDILHAIGILLERGYHDSALAAYDDWRLVSS